MRSWLTKRCHIPYLYIGSVTQGCNTCIYNSKVLVSVKLFTCMLRVGYDTLRYVMLERCIL